MLHNGQRPLAELGDFLAALRLNGVPVGPVEVDRLRQLFALEPRLDRESLKSLLSALLVKTSAQREVFEVLFAGWCPDHDADWPEEGAGQPHTEHSASPTPQATQAPQALAHETTPEMPRHRLTRRLLTGMAIGLLSAGLLWLLWPPTIDVHKTRVTSVDISSRVSSEESSPHELPASPVEHVWFWQASVDPAQVHAPRRLSPLELALLGLMALATALAAWWRYAQRFPNVQPTPRRYVGYGWQPLPPPARDDTALIEARDRRQLVWNIEHFVSDDPTRRLDLDETVDATARAGGFVHLRFQPAVYAREIWFWLDRQLDRSTPRTAVQQLLRTLSAGGLEAHQGLFTDVPDRVDWPGQTGYRPAHEEGAGRQALVAIFTDGEGLARRLENPLSHAATDRLLRTLRRWPRLCFVECAATDARLAALLAPYGLETIVLDELPRWLGGLEPRVETEVQSSTKVYGDARVWAAAVALGGAQAETASAQSLRVALRLNASPWRVDQILAEARQPGSQQRLINWLLRCEPQDERGMPQPGSLTRQSLDWWEQRYAAATQDMQAQENPLLPWQDSLASQRWQMERALLDLYLDPDHAAQKLAQLADDALRDDIHARLSTFAAADHRPGARGDDSAFIYCTWRFADLPAITRHRLRQLGFAAGLFEQEPTPLKRSPCLVLAGSMLMMLALSACTAALYRWFTPNPPRLQAQEAVLDHPVLASQTVRLWEPLASGNYQITLGSARQIESLPSVPAGAVIPVTWRWQQEPNAVSLAGGDSVVLRAGRLAQPIRACGDGWPQRSLVVIAAPFAADEPGAHELAMQARQLAIRLLDKGSADQVLFSHLWKEHLSQWLGSSHALNQSTQVLVLLPDGLGAEHAAAHLADHPGPWAVAWSDDFASLARAIDFPGSKTVEKLSPWLHVYRFRQAVRMYGGPESVKSDPAGIEWVHVCPGTFTMGSITGEDKMADRDESVDPPRTVALSAFQIAATETTQRQDGTGDDVPIVDVNWTRARTFCQARGGDLPTEAQWEYAARGGSRFPWSFGDDEVQLGNYAWFGRDVSTAQEVGQKRPNPLGLYDMHGNVWEWTRDWYDNYASGVFVDPSGPNSGIARVVCGGSFDDPPEHLRSALRVVAHPEDRVGNVGFRCVRVPPQP